MNKMPVPTESAEQQQFIQWTCFARGQYGFVDRFYHVPNGGSRRPAEAKIFIAEGVKKGVPDLFLPVPLHGFHGLYIEFKRRNITPEQLNNNKGYQSTWKDQKAWLQYLSSVGYYCAVAFGCEEAIAITECYYKGLAQPNQHKSLCFIDAF